MNATDPDCGINGQIRYFIAEDMASSVNMFNISINSGWICIAKDLDFEFREVYDFPVIAKDAGTVLNFQTPEKLCCNSPSFRKYRVMCPKDAVEWQTVKTLIRLLQEEQSDLGLHCLPRPSYQSLDHDKITNYLETDHLAP